MLRDYYNVLAAAAAFHLRSVEPLRDAAEIGEAGHLADGAEEHHRHVVRLRVGHAHGDREAVEREVGVAGLAGETCTCPSAR